MNPFSRKIAPMNLCRYQWIGYVIMFLILAGGTASSAFGQVDQGTITGTVEDVQGGVIPHAKLILTNPSTGLTLQTEADGNGVYVFSPLKVGNYTITASAEGFASLTNIHIPVNVNQRTGLNFRMKPGSAAQTVTVTDTASQMQSEEGAIGQTFSTEVINKTPLEGRNYVYIAQLAAGVAPPNSGARGANRGDFSANGQRVEQNNFILDGVDNNVNLVDFLNGSSYVIKPPPDALQEFKVQTSNYSAELGHSAGAVINASIKSGTNMLHGSLWEYFRNDALNAKDYFDTYIPEYRENQFGATIGGPIVKNKLFFFADAEANRIIFGETGTYTVPTIKMRTGDFSELLNPSLTGQNFQRLLYTPGSAGTVLLQCNGQQNVICPGQTDPAAQKLINSFPLPNQGISGQTYSNYLFQGRASDNTTQYDVRTDWNATQNDQAFARYSNYNEPQYYAPPLGVLDGGAFSQSGNIENEGRNFAASETHIFTPTMTNEIRFGYNWIRAQLLQENIGQNLSAQYGLGGIPTGSNNGGLPYFSVSGASSFGSPHYYPCDESENVAELLDNITKVIGNHTFKAGFDLQEIRFLALQPEQSRGGYTFSGKYTENPKNTSDTGFGVADFLLDQISTSSINNIATTHDQRWDRVGYVQDDWKVNPQLTFNLGLRYEYAQPIVETDGRQANFVPDYANSTGQYLIPAKARNVPIPQTALAAFAANNIAIVYTTNNSLVNSQKTNFAPRFAFAYSPRSTTAIRGGFGLFYGGLESVGYGPNIGQNVPFIITSTFPSAGCVPNNCPTNGQTLETGFSEALAEGLNNFSSTPTLHSYQTNIQTPYTEQWNLAFQQAIGTTTSFTLAYVGSATRHLQLDPDPNQIGYLLASGANAQANRPFNQFGSGGRITLMQGIASYNGLQATIERHYLNGLYFLGTYTWSRALDDAFPPLGGNGDTYTSFRNWRQLGFRYDYGESYQNVPNRATANVQYDLPFGYGRRYLSHKGVADIFGGGWSTTFIFTAQSGEPLLVYPSFDSTNGVGKSYAYQVGEPFAAGNIATVNTGVTCATQVKTVKTWFNPCAYNNPPDATGANDLAAYGPKGRTMVSGPGYKRIDMSVFKSFSTFRSQTLQFRADIFNLFNTPAFGQPDNTLGGSAGQITSERFGGQGLAAEQPDARVIQLSLKYAF
jgi:hypothetical protein